jgi:DNA-directed RNA polymerase specialized sigma24 family protein
MDTEGSVTVWIALLRAGDSAAAQELWERYFRQLVGLARRKLPKGLRGAADEEDVALSALDSFYRRATVDGFSRLKDRHDLWRLLASLTARKVCRLLRHEGRQKRRGAFRPDARRQPCDETGVEQAAAQGPTPEMAAQMLEECRRLLGLLGDAQLQAVARWKLEGYTNEEIADKLGCAPRTVERKLGVIRASWERELGDER